MLTGIETHSKLPVFDIIFVVMSALWMLMATCMDYKLSIALTM